MGRITTFKYALMHPVYWMMKFAHRCVSVLADAHAMKMTTFILFCFRAVAVRKKHHAYLTASRLCIRIRAGATIEPVVGFVSATAILHGGMSKKAIHWADRDSQLHEYDHPMCCKYQCRPRNAFWSAYFQLSTKNEASIASGKLAKNCFIQ